MSERISQTIALTAVVMLLLRGIVLAAPLPDQACRAAKNKAAGKYASCRQVAEGKLATNGDVVKYADAIAKCGTKFATAWQKAIDKANLASATCPDDPLTVSDFQAAINVHTDNIASGLSGAGLQQGCVPATRLKTGQTVCYDILNTGGAIPCPTTGQDGELQRGITRSLSHIDNGDGTITDNITGLMWEKLGDDGSVLHDKDLQYTWATAFAKVATLNSSSFGGHNDWRLPNINELQTLANYGLTYPVDPAVDAAFDTNCMAGCSATGPGACSCTRPSYYWSSTTYQSIPARAWVVSFAFGDLGGGAAGIKSTLGSSVRAVRDHCVAAIRTLKTGQTICYDPTGATGNPASCPGTGQDGELQKGITRSYTDNNDGTITDNGTGLVWEKLNNDGSIHDRDDLYTWGEAFAIKVATLNSTNFAGHNDWRLPNINELQSLANYGVATVNLAVDTPFNTGCTGICSICSCTKTNAFYWSSTTYETASGAAWGVFFGDGNIHHGTKEPVQDWVRAVRGGCNS